MTAETVLAEEQIQQAAQSHLAAHIDGDRAVLTGVNAFIGAIEQAVLQSPEIQRLREDAERYRFLRDCKLDGDEEKAPWIAAARNDNSNWGLTGEIADASIDAAMERQP